jgi:hypothetical protein
MDEKTLAILREFRGKTCRCGKPKREKNAFCRWCYGSLPRDLQQAIYRHQGVEKFIAAHERACGCLDAMDALNQAKSERLKA